MGKEIVYCCRCSSRILADDFDRGRALWVAGKPSCSDCVLHLVGSLPPAEEQRVLESLRERRSETAAPTSTAPAPARPSTGRHLPAARTRLARRGGGGMTAAAAAGGGGLLLLLALLVAIASRRPPTPAPAIPPPAVAVPRIAAASPPAPAPPRPSAKEGEARTEYEKALVYGKEHPDDIPGRLARLEEAVWEARGTSLFEEVKRDHERLRKERAALLEFRLAPLLARADAAEKAETFGEALAALARAREEVVGRDWTSAIDQKMLQVRTEADRVYAGLRTRAVDAARRGAAGEAKAAVDRVAAWRLDDLAVDLHAALAAVPPPPPPLSPAAVAYRTSWRKAVDLARARDYPAALRELETAAPPPELAGEAALDRELFHALAESHAELRRLLAAAPKGAAMNLELEPGADGPSRVQGELVKAAAETLDLRRDEEPLVLPLADVRLSSLRAALGAKPLGPKPAALAGLLEDGGASEGLPPKYAELSDRLAVERAESLPREEEARTLFDTAEREIREPGSVLAGFERLRLLGTTFADTLFVRRRRGLLAARLEEEKTAARDYVFSAERLTASGGFGPASHPKAASCWAVAADDPETRLEFSFSARADTDYRAWLYVGGCCGETFAFAWEDDGVRKPMKPSFGVMRKTHDQHGGPRVPSRFEWIPLALGRRPSAGPRTVGLVDVRPGFTVAYAVVSAVRTGAPTEVQLREWEKSRPSAPPAPRGAGLVAWWSLDEGKGTSAADASPNRLTGTLRNDPVWRPGRRGGALSFDGVDDCVEIPKSPLLHMAGAFSLAAWVNVAELPSSRFGMYVLADYAADGNRSTFALRILPDGAAQFFWQSDDSHSTHATSARRLAPGRWTHLAAVWDGQVRRIYVDGKPEGENAAAQDRPDVGGATAIGRPGSYDGLHFRGAIDDVRIYARGLSPAEIQALVLSK